MFGFSLTKLLILAVAVAVVWYGMKWLQGLQGLPRQRGKPKAGGSRPETIDLERDETTGDYVAIDPDEDRRA